MAKVEEFRKELQSELDNILSYWEQNTIDQANGGFIGKIDHFNNRVPECPKGAVLNARILWTYSAAFNQSNDNRWLKLASRAYEYLIDHFLDHTHGGLIWEVDYLGNPSNTRKQIYAQGFGIYGFSEYYKATGNEESLEIAKSLFHLIEKHSFDEANGGYIEALSADWEPLEDMRLSEKDANYPKSMNTHLHILEPYTNLYRVCKDEELETQIKRLIRTFLDQIIDTGTGHFHLFFEKEWQVRSDIISYGHDIEGAWLLTEAAEALGDESLLKEVQQMAIKMTDATIEEGLDVDGGLFYEKEGDHLDADKHWWPQAEAMVGFLNAFQISGDEKYLNTSMQSWEFIKANLLDKENGEWYWKVDQSGNPDPTHDKAGFWKCPYHNSRACIEVINRLRSVTMD